MTLLHTGDRVGRMYAFGDEVARFYDHGVLVFERDLTGSLVYDEFSRYADGQVPDQALVGGTWRQFSGPGYVTAGHYDSEIGSGASYIEQDTNARIDGMEARFRWDTLGGARTGLGGTLCLVSWADGGIVTNGFGRRTRAHVVITPTGISYFVRDVLGNNITVTNIRSWGFATPLALDTYHEFRVSIDGTTATVSASNGFVGTVTDPRIAPRDGETFACFEPYYSAEATDARVRVASVRFTGEPIVAPPVPDGPALVGSTQAVRAGTTSSPSPDMPSFVMPPVNDGDVVLVSVSAASTGQTFTLSGLAFVTKGTQSRTGASSQVFSRVASAADSGKVVTVSNGGGVLFVIGVLVLRGVTDVLSVTAQNSGTVTTVIYQAPAFTPTDSTLPIHVLAPVKASPLATVFNPPVGMTKVTAFDPPADRQTGLYWGYSLTPGEAVAREWANTTSSNHYYTSFLITVGVA